jgi:hypothetical protein
MFTFVVVISAIFGVVTISRSIESWLERKVFTAELIAAKGITCNPDADIFQSIFGAQDQLVELQNKTCRAQRHLEWFRMCTRPSWWLELRKQAIQQREFVNRLETLSSCPGYVNPDDKHLVLSQEEARLAIKEARQRIKAVLVCVPENKDLADDPDIREHLDMIRFHICENLPLELRESME